MGADVSHPVRTIRTAGGQIMASANLIQYHTEQTERVRANGMGFPLPTVDASNRYGLTTEQLWNTSGTAGRLMCWTLCTR